MRRTRLVAVGACAIDIILSVPHFPKEDSKLRASSCTKRRGGNCPNTLEVLQQLIGTGNGDQATELFLITTLPSRAAVQTTLIAESFNNRAENDLRGANSDSKLSGPAVHVRLSHCIYREDFTEPVSSYIVSAEDSTSRTIINYNALPEMTLDEFITLADDLISRPNSTEPNDAVTQLWYHFEGRMPDVTLECMRYVRAHNDLQEATVNLRISVELEKPGRPGLQELAYEADVVFYSRSWAEGEGYPSPEQCLKEQADFLRSCDAVLSRDRLLVSTWGASGASGVLVNSSPELDIVHSPAYISHDRPVIDTTGAGDTFIAGVLYGLMAEYSKDYAIPGVVGAQPWSLQETLDFANGLAGRKILQHGFRFSFPLDIPGSRS